MDNRHLWIRSRKQHAVLKVRHTVIKATRDFFDDNGFILADTPIFTPAACEGTTTLFEVDYFEDDKAYLDAKRTALQRSDRRRFRQKLCFRSGFSRRKIENAPSFDRILDGRAGNGLRASRRRDEFGRRID
jgi:asparaginyl-tRNA synthetase